MITKAESAVPAYEVVSHPAGGFAIGHRLPNSSVLIYDETHSSKGFLERLIDRRRRAAIQEALAVRPHRDSEQQMGFNLDLPSTTYRQ